MELSCAGGEHCGGSAVLLGMQSCRRRARLPSWGPTAPCWAGSSPPGADVAPAAPSHSSSQSIPTALSCSFVFLCPLMRWVVCFAGWELSFPRGGMLLAWEVLCLAHVSSCSSSAAPGAPWRYEKWGSVLVCIPTPSMGRERY